MASISLTLYLVVVSIFGIDAWTTKCHNNSPNSSPYNKFYLGPNNRCYALMTGAKDWCSAKAVCEDLDEDAFLAVISSTSELDWISSHIDEAPGYDSSASYWVGGKKSRYVWKWDKTGSDVSMQHPPWANGEPNGSGSGNCMVIDKSGGGDWQFYDRPEGNKYGCICEIAKNDLNG